MRKEWLRFDLIAGLTTAAVVIPKAMAYATIAGLPVQVGLATALVPMAVYAFLGSSRPLSVSTTTTIAILTAAQLGQIAPDGDAVLLAQACATLTLLTGTILALACLLRLGFVATFISEPVLVGFKAGIAFVIVLDQVPKLLGVHFAKGGFVHNLLEILKAIPETSPETLAVAAATMALLIGLGVFAPRVPGPLVAVVAGIGGAMLLGLETAGVEPVGDIPQGFPPVTLPDISLVTQLWPGALGIALMSFIETIAAGRAFASSDEPPIRPNRELLATGCANVGGALLGAMSSGGGTSQTAVNRQAGARTQLAGLVAAGATLATMFLLASWMGRMPLACLAAIVVVTSVGLFKPKDLRAILVVRRMEFVWAIVTLASVVLLGTLRGILVAVLLSFVSLAHQASNPAVHVLGRKPGTNVFRPRTQEHPEDEDFPGLLILRPEGRIFFANVERIGEKIRPLMDEAQAKVVVLDLSGVFDLEYTALKMLTAAENRMRERGVSLWLAGLGPEVLAMVQRSPLGATLGRERMHFNLETAVAKYADPAP